MESFGGRRRDELLAVEAFSSLLEARVLVEDRRIEYNPVRPHSALGYLTSTDYAKTWTATPPHTLIADGPTTGSSRCRPEARASVDGYIGHRRGGPAPATAHRAACLRRPTDERLRRRILAAGWGRTRRGESLRLPEPERALLDQADRPVPASELDRAGPLPLLAVAQLYCRDVPDLAGPEGADLLQLLWCPFSGHGDAGDWDLAVVLKWRRAAEIDLERVLVAQPEPPVMQSGDFLPEPCVLHPGQHYYGYNGVAIAPGWKVGGWTRGVDLWRLWRRPLVCACGELMELLLKIEGAEWGYDEDRGDYPWRPLEDADGDGDFEVFPAETQPTMIMIGDAYPCVPQSSAGSGTRPG